MPWFRYLAYFFAIAFVTWALAYMELVSPGSLKIQVMVSETDRYGTSEYSPIEIIQAIILACCAAIMAWVARHCPTQRPLAIGFLGLALAFLIRELDYFLDRFVADNFWQLLIGVLAALAIAYIYRHRRRVQVALARIWPSPGLALLYAGAIILFAFVRLVGHEPLWQSILGDDYRRIVKLAVEEFIELAGYFLWMVGTVDYALQSRAQAKAEPQPAARRRRDKRRHDSEGKF